MSVDADGDAQEGAFADGSGFFHSASVADTADVDREGEVAKQTQPLIAPGDALSTVRKPRLSRHDYPPFLESVPREYVQTVTSRKLQEPVPLDNTKVSLADNAGLTPSTRALANGA